MKSNPESASYTIDRLARMAGVTTRTLRHYDHIGLLKPSRLSASNYRVYGQAQVDRLQQILLYREMELPLECIRQLLDDPSFDEAQALIAHRAALIERQAQLSRLIKTVDQTIKSVKEGIPMSDQAKFEGFKRQLIDENEKKYGSEVREKYGADAVDASNRKLLHMIEEAYHQMQHTEAQLKERLGRAVQSQCDPAGEEGRAVFELHKAWLKNTWSQYSAEAHKGVAQMYVEDERFTAYYDKDQPGCAAFLRDAVHAHA